MYIYFLKSNFVDNKHFVFLLVNKNHQKYQKKIRTKLQLCLLSFGYTERKIIIHPPLHTLTAVTLYQNLNSVLQLIMCS